MVGARRRGACPMRRGGRLNAEQFFARLRSTPARDPALQDSRALVSYGELLAAVEALAGILVRERVRTLASVLPNNTAWVIADLAALRAGVVHVPLPLFFTDEQRAHALAAAGVDAVLSAKTPRAVAATMFAVGSEWLALSRRIGDAVAAPPGTRKITFTSGTTGQPKGVCLGETSLTVAASLAEALAPVRVRRHLCALPLPVLLENIAGVYAPLATGATVVIPSAHEAGLAGSSSFNPAALDAAVQRYRADSTIVLPQMLRAWAAWRTAVRAAPQPTLKFVAVGGARVGHTAIAQARRSGLPAFEGYGLSEAASVQTLNLPHADRPGSAGKPLPHARLRVDNDGQIWVSGALMLGYLGAPWSNVPQWWATGDIGRIDDEGFLHIDGRRGNVLITSFGRNVSPEWVESELQASTAIAHAAVFGDGQPQLTAVLWPARADTTDSRLDEAVAQANTRLPDYARVARWTRARVPFSDSSGMATANGRPRRESIAQAHQEILADDDDTALIPDLPETDELPRPTARLDR
jgi:long-subunit acyl-CoA synthetase (AMP-forming)